MITAAVAAAVVVSPWWGACVGAVSAVALAATVKTFRRAPEGDDCYDGVVSHVLAVIVLDVVLATCRYVAALPSQLAIEAHGLFSPSFQLTDSNWFVTFVVAPVSLMLLGAYYLTRRSPLGLFMAWWSAVYAVADGALQIRILVLPGSTHGGAELLGAAVATLQTAVGLTICRRLMRRREDSLGVTVGSARPGLTPRQRNLWTVIFVCAVAIYGATLYAQSGLLPVGVIVGSMMGGLVGWRKTTALRAADPLKAVPLFLLLLALFYVHVGEEALTSFNAAIASLSGTPWTEHDYTLLIGLLGPAAWFAAGLSLWHRQPFGNFVLWFLIVGMILGEPAHLLVFPTLAMYRFGVGYGYFSGMYTALFPMVPAIVALVTIVRDHRLATASRAA